MHVILCVVMCVSRNIIKKQSNVWRGERPRFAATDVALYKHNMNTNYIQQRHESLLWLCCDLFISNVDWYVVITLHFPSCCAGNTPLHLRSPTISRDQFRSGLKSHLFKCAYTWLHLRELLRSELIYLLSYLLTYLLIYLHCIKSYLEKPKVEKETSKPLNGAQIHGTNQGWHENINDIIISWYYHDIFNRKYHDVYQRKYQPFFITFFIICYGQTKPTTSACMTSSSSGSGTDQTATNNKRATAGKWRLNGQ